MKLSNFLQFKYIDLRPAFDEKQVCSNAPRGSFELHVLFSISRYIRRERCTGHNQLHHYDWGPQRTYVGRIDTLRNDTKRLVAKRLETPHHSTIQYCLLTNGGIERQGKELLQSFQAALPEL